MRTRQVPIGDLRPYPGNPRTHDIPAIRASLRANGQYRAIVVCETGTETLPPLTILAGHGTVEGAEAEGWKTILAHLVQCDDDQARRIVLADNRTAELGGYDNQALAKLLGELRDFDGTGWRPDDLQGLLRSLDTTPRETPPVARPRRPKTRAGDLIELGPHRLLCGDARDADHVAELMAGDPAEMVWTDPPYGVDLGNVNRARGVDHGDMAGDAPDLQALRELLLAALGNAAANTTVGGAIYVCHSDTGGTVFREALVDAGWTLRQVLIWVKQQHVLGRQDYQWMHEPILYGWKPGAAHRWWGGFDKPTVIDDDVDIGKLSKADLRKLVTQLRDATPSTVVREDRPHVADMHPTCKPVELCARLIANSSEPDDVVLDPFAGSGSTLIACENLRRRARLVEIDPGYCDVIVDRWQRHTERTATRPTRSKR